MKTNENIEIEHIEDSLGNKKGITLVALIITVIIMLILAGVSINVLFGQEGILNKTQTAVQQYQNAQNDEQVMLDEIQNHIDKIEVSSSNRNEYNTEIYDEWRTWLHIAGIF